MNMRSSLLFGLAATLAACAGPTTEQAEDTASNRAELGRDDQGRDDDRDRDHGRGHDHDDGPSPLARGKYLVGSKTIYVRDRNRRFDPWNETYGSPDYKALLAHLAAIGEPRTLVSEVWYPVDAPRGCDPERDDTTSARCTPHGATRPTYLDYARGNRSIFDRRGVSPYMITASGQTAGAIQATDPVAYAALEQTVLNELASRKRGSFVNAEAARGNFPLVILSHGGFTGNVRPDSHREIWTSLGEKLASHGYVVVAMNHTGDSRQPAVFSDSGSKLLQTGGTAAVNAAYETLFSQAPVPDRITSLIFAPGGFPLAHTMMQKLFEMRSDDVMSVYRAIKALDDDRNSFLGGRVDTKHVGVAGHSLGSMTTQIVVSSESAITTGMGWNNGLPKAWEPPRFRPIKKPILLSLAYEDDLSRTFFTNVPFLVYPNVVPGGQPSDFLFLPAERVFPPTLANPEPVVRSCYERANGPKLLLGLVDSTHWDVTDYDDYLFPRHRLAAGQIAIAFDNVLQRLPFGADVLDPSFVGAPYATESWKSVGGGRFIYEPHEVRDYYSVAWFGYYLKGIDGYRRHIRRDPFGSETVVHQEDIGRR